MLKAKTKTSKKNSKTKTKMKKQNNIPPPPPSPALIRQLNLMGYVITNDNVIIKVKTTKEGNEVN